MTALKNKPMIKPTKNLTKKLVISFSLRRNNFVILLFVFYGGFIPNLTDVLDFYGKI